MANSGTFVYRLHAEWHLCVLFYNKSAFYFQFPPSERAVEGVQQGLWQVRKWSQGFTKCWTGKLVTVWRFWPDYTRYDTNYTKNDSLENFAVSTVSCVIAFFSVLAACLRTKEFFQSQLHLNYCGDFNLIVIGRGWVIFMTASQRDDVGLVILNLSTHIITVLDDAFFPKITNKKSYFV